MNGLHHLWFVWVWPSIKGNGPEDVLATIAVALLTVLLWPPIRRRIHHFIDAKVDTVHVKLNSFLAHHKEHKEDLTEIKRMAQHIIDNHPDIPPLPPKESVPS